MFLLSRSKWISKTWTIRSISDGLSNKISRVFSILRNNYVLPESARALISIKNKTMINYSFKTKLCFSVLLQTIGFRLVRRRIPIQKILGIAKNNRSWERWRGSYNDNRYSSVWLRACACGRACVHLWEYVSLLFLCTFCYPRGRVEFSQYEIWRSMTRYASRPSQNVP